MIGFNSLINEPCASAQLLIVSDADLQAEQSRRSQIIQQELDELGPEPQFSLSEDNQPDGVTVTKGVLIPKKVGSCIIYIYAVTGVPYVGTPPQLWWESHRVNNWRVKKAQILCSNRPELKRVYGTTQTVFEYRATIYNKESTIVDFDFFAMRNAQDTDPYPLDNFLNTGKTKYFSCPILDDPWFNRNQQSYDGETTKVTFELKATVTHKVYVDNGSSELVLEDSNLVIKADSINTSQTFKDFAGNAGLASIPSKISDIFTKWLKNNSHKEPKFLASPQIPDDFKDVTCADDCGRNISIRFLKRYKARKYIQTVSQPPNSVPSYRFYTDVHQQYGSLTEPKIIRCTRKS